MAQSHLTSWLPACLPAAAAVRVILLDKVILQGPSDLVVYFHNPRYPIDTHWRMFWGELKAPKDFVLRSIDFVSSFPVSQPRRFFQIDLPSILADYNFYLAVYLLILHPVVSRTWDFSLVSCIIQILREFIWTSWDRFISPIPLRCSFRSCSPPFHHLICIVVSVAPLSCLFVVIFVLKVGCEWSSRGGIILL